MDSNPLFGLILHWLGGLASGSFYVFYGRVRNWSWETYWLAGGLFSWVVMPWTMGYFMTHDLLGVLARTPTSTLFLCWLFGALWGLGCLTAGLAIRFLGMSLGQGVALGFCAAFGTLMPPLFKGQLAAIAASTAGRVTLLGIAVSLVGIALAALAGLYKEQEMSEEKKKEAIKEFSFTKGMIVAVFAGIMSGFFAFGLDAGNPIGALSAAAGTAPMWAGLPKLIVVLFGGFTMNFICCVAFSLRKKTIGQFVGHGSGGEPMPVANNYLFCALAGITWYLQFFFYTMGESQMGRFRFSSWTLHMASIIIFSTMWGWILREWQGASRRTQLLIAAGMTVLVLSTLIVGYGNYLGVHPGLN